MNIVLGNVVQNQKTYHTNERTQEHYQDQSHHHNASEMKMFGFPQVGYKAARTFLDRESNIRSLCGIHAYRMSCSVALRRPGQRKPREQEVEKSCGVRERWHRGGGGRSLANLCVWGLLLPSIYRWPRGDVAWRRGNPLGSAHQGRRSS